MPSLVEIDPVVLETKIFFNFVNVFSLFPSYLPLEKDRALIWTNLNPLHPRMHFAKFGCNWPSGSGDEDFFNFVNAFSLFRNYLSLEKDRALHLNKLESPSFKNALWESPSINDALCQIWLKLAQWFWRRRFFFILSMYFRYFVHISPWKRVELLIWTNLNPLHPRMLCAKFGWNWLSGFTTTTTTMTTTTTTTKTDNGQILIRKPQLSLRLRWAKIK